MGENGVLQIVGAGPSGLAAAIVAARAGQRVVVAERHRTVGARFRGDFQGLENWTSVSDVLEEFREFGIDPTFETTPVFEQICFGPDGREHRFQSGRPFYYLIRRGPAPGTLDTALLRQALDVGVEVSFGETVHTPSRGSLGARGPRHADVIAVGIIFETDLPDGYFAGLGGCFAPGGYGYLLVNGGRATLASCMFSDFRKAKYYLDRTVRFFQQRLSFTLRNVRRFGGVGNAFLAPPLEPDPLRRIGEASGAQDALWGFGIRFAVRSGALAARYGSGNFAAYRRTWEQWVGHQIRTSIVNRFFFDRTGDLGYHWLLWRLARTREPWKVLHDLYSPVAWKRAFFPATRLLLSRSSRVHAKQKP